MFEFLKRWFGMVKSAQGQTADDQRLAMRYDRLGDVPTGESLRGKIVVLCRGRQLMLTTDEALPERFGPGEICWVVPNSDMMLPLQVRVGDVTLAADVLVRFETDQAFAAYAYGRDSITKAELVALVAGQWSELAELERITAEQLLGGNADLLSRFRTHLSLLLQEYGFRCVGLENIRKAESCETPEIPELSNDADAELKQAVTQVQSESAWENLLDQLDEAGFEPNLQTARQLESLGQDYVSRKISADETTSQIRKMIERKNLEISAIRRDTESWNATEIKLRLLDSVAENDEQFLFAASENLPTGNRVPSTWYMLRKYKIDAKLQKYLRDSLGEMLKLLDLAKNRQSDLVAKSKLADSQATLKRLQDHLSMMPTLKPGHAKLQRRQRDLGELLDAVRRGVTSTQLTAGLLRKLAAADYSPKEYENIVRDLENALNLLENDLRERKNVYAG